MAAPQAVPATPGEWLTQPLYRRRKTPTRKTTPPTTQNPAPAKREPSIRVPAKNLAAAFWQAFASGNLAEQQTIFKRIIAYTNYIALQKHWFLPGDRSESCWNGCICDALEQWKIRHDVSFRTILTRRMIDAIEHERHGRAHEVSLGRSTLLEMEQATGQGRRGNTLWKRLERAQDDAAGMIYIREMAAFLEHLDPIAARMHDLRLEGYTWDEVAAATNLASEAAARIRYDRKMNDLADAIDNGQLRRFWVNRIKENPTQELPYIARQVFPLGGDRIPTLEAPPAPKSRRTAGRDVSPEEWETIKKRLADLNSLESAADTSPENS